MSPSFVSILKAIGRGAATIFGVTSQVAQAVSPYIPAGPANFLVKAIAAVGRAEQAANQLATVGVSVGGAGKLALADAFAAEALDIAELVSGKEIGDNDKYRRGVEAIAAGRKLILSGTADVLDSLRNKS